MLSLIALSLTLFFSYVVWFQFAQTQQGRDIGLLVFGIPAGLCSYLLVAQRLRDFAVSGWFALLWVPINALGGEARGALTFAALIVLCGVPGTVGMNKFGPDPLESS